MRKAPLGWSSWRAHSFLSDVRSASRYLTAFASLLLLIGLTSSVQSFADVRQSVITVEPAAAGLSDKVLAAALARARAELSQGKSVTIRLAPGTYRLSQPIKLDDSVSGTPGAPLKIIGDPAGPVILTSAVPLTPNDVPADLGALLPRDARASVRAFSLPPELAAKFAARRDQSAALKPSTGITLRVFQGWKPLRPAAWPNDGYELQKIASPQTKPNVALSISVAADRAERLSHEPAAMVEGYFFAGDWFFDRSRIAHVDLASSSFTTDAFNTPYSEGTQRRFRITNAVSELDQAGEMVVLPERGLVLAIPTGAGAIEAAGGSGILSIDGAHDVVIDGIALRGTDGDALSIDASRNITFTNGYIGQTRGLGANVNGDQNVTVSRTVFADMGLSGVSLNGGDTGTLQRGNNRVVDNIISGVSRDSPAIDLSGVGQTVAGNFIHDVPRAGILFRGNDHQIAANEVARTNGETADFGALYTYANLAGRGTVIEGNYIHDVGQQAKGPLNMGVYLDGWTSGITVARNLFADDQRGIWVNSGSDNVLHDNIFVRNQSEPILLSDQRVRWNGRAGDFVRKSAQRVTPAILAKYGPNILRAIQLKGAPAMNTITGNIIADGPGIVIASTVAANQHVAGQVELDLGANPVGPEQIGRSLAAKGVDSDIDFSTFDRRAALSNLRYAQRQSDSRQKAAQNQRSALVSGYRALVESTRQISGATPEALHLVVGGGLWSAVFALLRPRADAPWWGLSAVIVAEGFNEIQDYMFWGYVRNDTLSDILLTIGPALLLTLIVLWLRRSSVATKR